MLGIGCVRSLCLPECVSFDGPSHSFLINSLLYTGPKKRSSSISVANVLSPASAELRVILVIENALERFDAEKMDGQNLLGRDILLLTIVHAVSSSFLNFGRRMLRAASC